MANDKVFVGKTSVINTKFGEIVKVALGPQDFEVLLNAKNEKGWVNLEIKDKRQDFEVLLNAKNEKGWVNLEIKDKRDGGKYIQLQGEYTGKPKAQAVNDGDDMPF